MRTRCAPSSRNLTDEQLDAIAASGGIVGVNFAITLPARGRLRRRDTPLTEIVRHVDYLVERMGIDHVAFGSDFDGAVVPDELGGVAGLPKLVDALRADGGYDDEAIAKLTHRNWLRVLDDDLDANDGQARGARSEPRAVHGVITSSPCWLKTSLVVKIVPRRGFVADGCESVTVTRPVRRSPGRTGAVQRISSTPGEPSDAESSRIPRTNRPMKSAVVCQPLAIRPPNGLVLRRLRIDVERLRVEARRELDRSSSSVTSTVPSSVTSPTWKSSQ